MQENKNIWHGLDRNCIYKMDLASMTSSTGFDFTVWSCYHLAVTVLACWLYADSHYHIWMKVISLIKEIDLLVEPTNVAMHLKTTNM